MPSVGEINSFNDTLLGKRIEEPKDRGAPEGETLAPRRINQVGGGEVALLGSDESRSFAPRPSEPDSRTVDRRKQFCRHTRTVS
jgi:hypothetical protein